MRSTLAFLILACLASSARADPFDDWCKTARLPSSIAICSDSDLRALAQERQHAFDDTNAKLSPDQQKALLADQNGWVKSYPLACGLARDVAPALPLAPAIKDCMAAAGRARIAYLRAYAAELPAPTAGPLPPVAFQQGQADRRAWEAWFISQTGESRAGADYWAAHRSLPNAGSCNAAPPSTGADWSAGCVAAQKKLAAPDVRRKTEPEYRLGWNAPVMTPSTTPPPTPTEGALTSPAASGSETLQDHNLGEPIALHPSSVAAPMIAPPAPAPAPSASPSSAPTAPAASPTTGSAGGGLSDTTENSLIAAIDKAAADYNNAPNEMAQGAVRVSRRGALASLLAERDFADWQGTIESMSSTNDGRGGVLAVRISPHITLSTYNTYFADSDDHTLIQIGSPLWNSVVHMNVGDRVVISGQFVPDNDDYIKETSLTVSGGMTDPDFVVRFTSVEASATQPTAGR